MLETTVAGSLPKPSWLAEPEKLWAPWRLSYVADDSKKDPEDPLKREQTEGSQKDSSDTCFVCQGLIQSNDQSNLIVGIIPGNCGVAGI